MGRRMGPRLSVGIRPGVACGTRADRPRARALTILTPLAMIAVAGCAGTTADGPLGTPLTTRPASVNGAARSASTESAATVAGWPEYHGGAGRAGTGQGPDPRHAHAIWTVHVDGDVQASPVTARGIVVVATENDTVYALDARAGRILWTRHVGDPVPRSALPCGNIFPLGITGTPVIDTRTGVVAVVAETAGGRHTLVELDLSTGTERARAVIDPAGTDPIAHQQRGALALDAGRIVVAMGGLDGDCADYRGYVVSADEATPARQLLFTVPTPREGGIWAPAGPVTPGIFRFTTPALGDGLLLVGGPGSVRAFGG